MKKNQVFHQFENLYPVSKTLKFELLPVGETERHILENRILESDEDKNENAKKVKKIMDDYHKKYITHQLKDFRLTGLDTYYELYIKQEKTDEEFETLRNLESVLRKEITNQLSNSDVFNTLDKKDMIEKNLPIFLKEENRENEIYLVEKFHKFTSYFTNYFISRKKIYSDEAKASSLSYRLINENLPLYIKNMEIFKRIEEAMIIDENMRKDLKEITHDKDIEDYFTIDGFNDTFIQKGIEEYNAVLGGIKKDNKTQIKGLNVIINEYNQKAKKDMRIPKLNMLYNQILSTEEKLSFLIHQFSNDQELIDSTAQMQNMIETTCFANGVEKVCTMLSRLTTYDLKHIYINKRNLSQLSQNIYHDWKVITDAINHHYDQTHLKDNAKMTKTYLTKRTNELKKITDYSIDELSTYVNDYDEKHKDKIVSYFMELGHNKKYAEKIMMSYHEISHMINQSYGEARDFMKNDETISLFKNYLDTIKEYQEFVYSLMPINQNNELDMNFYSVLFEVKQVLENVIDLYNQSRNYLTQKAYSPHKIKLNFNNSTLLSGWDMNKEIESSGMLFEKDGYYYLGLLNGREKGLFQNIIHDDNEKCFRKMQYKLLPSPNKMLPKVFFSKSRKDEFGVDEELLEKYKKGYYKKGPQFDIGFCRELIDFYKESLNKHPEWKNFGFQFKDTEEYNDISEFYRDVETQGYKVTFQDIPESYMMQLVKENKLYLFKIYNKDFSKYSKGKMNLHTMYWKALFSESNLQNPVYKLNGNAELFYRKASLSVKETAVHPANHKIDNKNPLNEKKQSVFNYDLIKDKRYTENKFFFHVPLTMNFQSHRVNNINELVNRTIQKSDDMHIIGINRGERHLIYMTVIDMNGYIVHQESLNTIVSNKCVTDYHQLLSQKELERDQARKSWKTIENIKELKEGYISQVIHRIAKLIVEYNAIIVLEDLDLGFKNSRAKIDKQIYQRFEKQLIEKLNYLVFKDCVEDENGSVFHAYQLTNKFESFKKLGKQSGVLFYLPAWKTSEIDPVTGFVNQFFVKYESIEKSKDFFSKFDDIRYNTENNCFEFVVDDYGRFTENAVGPQKDWVLCSYGPRVEWYRDAEKNCQWTCHEVQLTEELQTLFKKYDIDMANIKESVLSQNEKSFFEQLIKLFKLMLQMGNYNVHNNSNYLISPVYDKDGHVFDSRYAPDTLPCCPDANGAYNVARKGLMIIQQIKETDDESLYRLQWKMSKEDYLEFIQK